MSRARASSSMTWPGRRSFSLIEPTKIKEKEKKPKASNVPEVSNAQARKTALVVAAVFFGIALWNVYRGRTTQVTIFGGIAGVIILIGLIPVAAQAFHRSWMGIAALLGYMNSRILLSILYYGLFTPVGLVRRLIGRDPMNRRGTPQSSYWVTRECTRQAKEQ